MEKGTSARGAARPPRAERRDSIRNRERIIDTARALFTSEGLDAPMDKIATTAGVAPGTLYRHFPSRLQLWEAVLEPPLRAQLELVDRAVANPDRWAGVTEFIMETCALEAERGGYLNLMTTRFDGAPRLVTLRGQIQRRIEELFDRAREEGAVRPDFTVEDLIFITLSNSRVAEVTRTVAPGAWRRNAELFLDSIRPERAHPLTQPPLKPSQVASSMMRPALGRSRSSAAARDASG
ncbi:TetR/AcrR family transcriptional regulator [Micromonospora sp. WMMD812]|uniref:TetR/AcrR family transcriptional regulator n=1 Tax=Micromonospora sp. WMMD812 TaxID=3015152 RepID=UPI00248BDE2A|nr:TetR/AcrR family transcriptional regulator [Micromonospora sp. WMMD812]WBB69348.1 helix-turn-helix domain containing protein [Micromonospora sp. WMMD812]